MHTELLFKRVAMMARRLLIFVEVVVKVLRSVLSSIFRLRVAVASVPFRTPSLSSLRSIQCDVGFQTDFIWPPLLLIKQQSGLLSYQSDFREF